MSYSSVPATSMYYAPESTWEKGVEKGGRFINDYFPHIQASTAALYTKGPAHVKIRAGAQAGVDAIIFQFLVRKMAQFQRWLQQKSPWLAEQTNKHPILSGLLGGGLTYGVAELGSGWGTKKIFGLFQGRETGWIKSGLDGMRRNSIGRGVLDAFGAVDKFMNKRAVKLGLGAAFIGLFVGVFAKAIKDRRRFKREYKQARQQYTRQDVDPLTLRMAILMHQRFALQQQKALSQHSLSAFKKPEASEAVTAATVNPFALDPALALALAPEIQFLQEGGSSPVNPSGLKAVPSEVSLAGVSVV